MQYPLMNASRSYRVSIPELKGGMNLYDSPEYIEDNQIAGGKNLWWMNGALRTRPGLSLQTINKHIYGDYAFFDIDIEKRDTSESPPYYGQYALLQTVSGSSLLARIDFVRYDGSAAFDFSGNWEIGQAGTKTNLIYTNGTAEIEEYRPEFLLFTSEGKIYMHYETKDENSMKDVTDSAYVPLVMVNGEPQTQDSQPVGTLFEGYNMLTGAFRAWFTSAGDGPNIIYHLPTNALTSYSGEDIVVEYLDNSGLTHSWTIPYNKSTSTGTQTIGGKAIYATVNRSRGSVFFIDDDDTGVPLPKSDVRNNVKITAWRTDYEKRNKIYQMTISTWFGGDRSSTNSGTRLFMSGNPQEPGLVHWSDINNPLYFPENNYAYIGDKSSQVTAFGKQQNILVLFKEHEMFYAEYVAGTPYTAEDVIEGRVVDVTAYAATFPITPINGYIGCDCPGTIRLCNNHLVWAASDGHVYTLASPNQYNQRNVQAISQMVESLLKTVSYEEWENARAVDYRGHYLLLTGNRIFLFNYGDSGFLYINSYYKQETAQRNIAWYVWDMAVPGVEWIYMMARVDSLLMHGVYQGIHVYYVLDTSKDTDDHPWIDFEHNEEIGWEPERIPYMFQTKQFDFNVMEKRKTINSIYIWSGESTEADITYILERCEMQDVNALLPVSGVSRKTPNISRERTFGMRIEGKGNAEFSGITINYKLMGGVR